MIFYNIFVAIWLRLHHRSPLLIIYIHHYLRHQVAGGLLTCYITDSLGRVLEQSNIFPSAYSSTFNIDQSTSVNTRPSNPSISKW